MRDLRQNLLRSLLLTLAVLVSAASPGLAQVGKLLPVDEAVRDPAFFVFRARLQEAVARHDTTAVLEAVDPNIKIGFGGKDGVAAFRKAWKLQNGDKSPLWSELGLALALGGGFQGASGFAAPYVFSRWPEANDAFEHVAVLGTDVRVRAEPRVEGRILATLSFDIVRLSSTGRSRLTPAQAKEWTAVELRGGRTGYISSRFARSSVGYRALFNKVNGRWRMTAFVAGD
jgi:hypothetical protein